MSVEDPARLHFLPWVRAGGAAALASPDPLSGSLPAAGSLAPWVRVAGREISQPAQLHGPGQVAALAPHAVGRMEPPPETGDFEPNYFPFVELVGEPDLPWRFTPAGPGGRSQLRPWLVLVVVRRQEGVQIGPLPGSPLPVLRIDPPAELAAELPDLADSAAWVHVQSSVPPADVATSAEAATVARLLCPRRLLPDETWHACLVPAFDVGARAGSSREGATASTAKPAWRRGDTTLEPLPVYHQWTFSTGPEGDFESLARRLAPDSGGAVLGRVWLDVARPGPPLPDPPRGTRVARTAFVGALKTPGAERGGLPAEHADWFARKLEPLLEDGAGRLTYDPQASDPVVAPPLYAGRQAGRDGLRASDRPWLRPLNLDPTLRATAGLGAAVVCANQEALVASAWAQAGAAREAARAIDHGLLSAEAGRSVARRMGALDSGTLLHVTRRAHAWIPSPASGETLAHDLTSGGGAPTGLVSAALQRVTRPATPLARTWSAKPPPDGDARLTAAVTTAFLDAGSPTAGPALRSLTQFAAVGLPDGAFTGPLADTSSPSPLLRPVERSTIAGPLAGAALARHTAAGRLAEGFDGTLGSVLDIADTLTDSMPGQVPRDPTPLPAAALDLSGAPAAVLAGLDPLPSIRAGLLLRVTGLSALLEADGALPHRLEVAPRFTDPLSWDLVALDPRFLLPGAEQLAANRVALLAVDNDFVASFLAGANHELGRELVWREFPTSPALTFAHRFWDTGDDGPDDIPAISGWKAAEPGGNVIGVGADELSVVLIRGDVIRRYPGAHVYVVKGVWDAGEVVPDPARSEEPLLQGALDRRSAFYGFPVSIRDLRGRRGATAQTEASAGWFVAIEEPSHGPRFGLDAPAEDGSDLRGRPADWNALSWGHLVPSGRTLDAIVHADAREPLPRPPKATDSAVWGHNAAHMAAICWQRPFRVLLHADLLLPGP